MKPFTTVTVTNSENGAIHLQNTTGIVHVRLGFHCRDVGPTYFWSYESLDLHCGDNRWIRGPDMPLNEVWHHAMVFLGMVPPDKISHGVAKKS